jgi:hypothetical protein
VTGERFAVAHLDELERLPTASGPLWRPIRSRLDVRAFGVNAWTGEHVGDRVIERHREPDGPEELYVVLEGHATFTVGDEQVDAPRGTFVYVPPDTFREAVAAEPDTVVLAVGAKAGEAWEPKPWEDFHVALAYLAAGRTDEARGLVDDTLARHPGTWQGEYNAACFEALEGNTDAAFEHLRTAYDRAPDEVPKYADDHDLQSLRGDPRWTELFGP